ncbi:unnamed protein product [Chilo suppressalis]|uniref:Uncharacterized protein n=1 Tax=Chilo suppressalis TaxID=168631 RepID=A0ABN8B595_CHISP|nr:unnamed protein product [Chilo suppressalis]
MFNFSDNYYERKCYLQREQVPTQSVMKKKMSPALANVYFKSMRPKLKVLAGLEPPMKGGGSDWFAPPSELLKGRVVLKPMKKEFLTKLGYNGIDFFGEKLVAHYKKCLEEEKKQALLDSDTNWKRRIEAACRQQWEDTSKESASYNTNQIRHAFHEFTYLYSTSINKIESLLYDAAIEEIKRIKDETHKNMTMRLEKLVKVQATELYDIYSEKLAKEKARLKALFIEKLEQSRSAMGVQLHDINVEKHLAIEKLRNYLECQNLACRVYVALKEKEVCEKEMQHSKRQHEKKVKLLKEEIAMKDFEILLANEKESKREAFNKIWQKKICEVIKKLQIFIAYCLHSLPDHAEFFVNMEKLMMLQLNEAMENPSAESVFVVEDDQFHTPVPRPHPFFLFCDKGYKPTLDQDLCPKHCSSSASQLPVIVVNKRCIYAACDNFEIFTDKIKQYIHGKRGDDKDFIDDHDSTFDVPVKFTQSTQLAELKLKSSLMQVLQKEHPNLRNLETECLLCKVPHCFCDRVEAKGVPTETHYTGTEKEPSSHSIPSGIKIESRAVELRHDRQPKWESYLDYIEPRKCKCPKTAKKNLREHLPAYMRNTSIFESSELPLYERCSLTTLKHLVKKRQGKRTPQKPIQVESKTRDICTQYSDHEFDLLCTCISDDEVDRLYRELFKELKTGSFQIVDGSFPAVNIDETSSNFATDRAYSLRNLLATSPDLEEIFRKKDCYF